MFITQKLRPLDPTSTIELMFDGDNRGHYTGRDCALWLAGDDHEWQLKNPITAEDIATLNDDTADGYYDTIDDIIESATYTALNGHTWGLEWIDGSIFAVRDDHEYEEE